MKPPPACGTTAAYQRHRRLAESIDDACRAANSDYQHEKKAIARQRRQAENAARLAAMEAVAHGHPAGYDELYRAALLEELTVAFGGVR